MFTYRRDIPGIKSSPPSSQTNEPAGPLFLDVYVWADGGGNSIMVQIQRTLIKEKMELLYTILCTVPWIWIPRVVNGVIVSNSFSGKLKHGY